MVSPQIEKGKANPDVPVDMSKKKSNAGANGQPPVNQNVAPPADAQTPPPKGKKALKPAKKDQKNKAACDPNVETCPPAQ